MTHQQLSFQFKILNCSILLTIISLILRSGSQNNCTTFTIKEKVRKVGNKKCKTSNACLYLIASKYTNKTLNTKTRCD